MSRTTILVDRTFILTAKMSQLPEIPIFLFEEPFFHLLVPGIFRKVESFV